MAVVLTLPIVFHVIKGDVILRGFSYSIDGVTYQTDNLVETFYTEDKRFNGMTVILNLKDYHFKKEYLDIEFVFSLKNTVGYKYKELVNMRFLKMKDSDWYIIKRYNMSFDK